jgi:hypothetical protein
LKICTAISRIVQCQHNILDQTELTANIEKRSGSAQFSLCSVTAMRFAKPPERARNAQPRGSRCNKNCRYIPDRQELPDDERKCSKAQAAKRCTGGIYARYLTTSRGLRYPGALFLFFLVLIYQRRAGWKNGREGQEQAAKHWSIMFGKKSRDYRHASAEYKAHGELIPFSIF